MNAHTMNKFLFTLALLPALLTVSEGRTTLTASQPYGLRGEVVQVEVHYSSDSAEVVGAQFTLEYDPAQMTVGEILEGNASADHELFDEQETGKISLATPDEQDLFRGTLASFLLMRTCPRRPRQRLFSRRKLFWSPRPEKRSRTKPSKRSTTRFQVRRRGRPPSFGFAFAFLSAEDDGSDRPPVGLGRHRQVGQRATTPTRPGQYLITITASNFLGSKEATRRITVNAPYWALDADELGNGWKSFDWFGAFYQTTDSLDLSPEFVGSTVTGKPSTTPGCGRICGTGADQRPNLSPSCQIHRRLAVFSARQPQPCPTYDYGESMARRLLIPRNLACPYPFFPNLEIVFRPDDPLPRMGRGPVPDLGHDSDGLTDRFVQVQHRQRFRFRDLEQRRFDR